MEGDTLTLDEYRTGYIAERHDVTDNCARALQLFEIGFSTSGVAKHLNVTESTARSYKAQLQTSISKDVIATHTSNSRKFDVWGDRDITEMNTLGYDDGVADARQKDDRTVPKEAIEPKFQERQRPLNRGMSLGDIPKELIASPLN